MPDEKRLGTLEQAFEDTVATDRGVLAPGAEAALRRRFEAAVRGNTYTSRAAVVGDLVGFLEGDDHRKALEKGDQAAARVSDPRTILEAANLIRSWS